MKHSPLIPAEDLGRVLRENEDVVLLDARSPEAYAAGHLEGARHAGVDAELSAAREPGADPARGGRHPLPSLDRWLRVLGEWGIAPRTSVVVYDDQAGANAAARAWWMLRSVGHERVAVLDGGFQAASAAGFAVTQDRPVAVARPPYPATQWSWPVAGIDDIERMRLDPHWKVLDVRSQPRFHGETEPIDPVAGHIPGAVNLPFAENLDGDRFKPASVLRSLYEELLDGLSPQRLVVHCGSGVTACHTLLALDAAGLHGASLYVGSWSEWCRNDRPQAKGD